jgi:hypothetical protein
MKTCTKCKEEKPLSEFSKGHRRNGVGNLKGMQISRSRCKACDKARHKAANELLTPAEREQAKENNRAYAEANKERFKKRIKAWNDANKEKMNARRRFRRATEPELREKDRARCKEYNKTHKKNRPLINSRKKERYDSDPLYKCRILARSAIRQVLKSKNFHKKHKTNQILKCSFEYFFYYIERQFKEGMTWENHGEWELDHAVPHSLGITAEEVIALNHYSNFQPLWKEDNLKKTNKLILDMISPENKIRYKTIISRHV